MSSKSVLERLLGVVGKAFDHMAKKDSSPSIEVGLSEKERTIRRLYRESYFLLLNGRVSNGAEFIKKCLDAFVEQIDYPIKMNTKEIMDFINENPGLKNELEEEAASLLRAGLRTTDL